MYLPRVLQILSESVANALKLTGEKRQERLLDFSQWQIDSSTALMSIASALANTDESHFKSPTISHRLSSKGSIA